MSQNRWHRALLSNHSYLYVINIFHAVVGLFPEPVRGLLFKAVLKRVGKGVYFDARVYFKFPWLVEIGNYVSINRGCEFYPSHSSQSRIQLGSNIRIGPNTKF
ncbi:MAG TPA: hypothetical protein VIM06_04140, partial [Rhodanobacter sp.]